MSKSGIFYDMRTQRLNSHMPKLAVAWVALVTLAAVACNGDESSPVSGSPSPGASPVADVTPVVTPGSGADPIQAVATYIDVIGLDGHRLDNSRQAECPLEPVQTVTAGTPITMSTLYLAQFCLTSQDWQPEEATTIIVDLPDTGEAWEMKLELDSEVSLWKVEDINKVSE